LKLLIFSDSHGNIEYMRRGIVRERPDQIIHLGDLTLDVQRLRKCFPDLPVEQVRGNCDGRDSIPEERELLVGGKRLWLLHGHTHQVKWGLSVLREEAQARGVDAVFFGHTHHALCAREGHLWIVNPGTCRGFPEATCAVAEISDGQIVCRMMDLKEEP